MYIYFDKTYTDLSRIETMSKKLVWLFRAKVISGFGFRQIYSMTILDNEDLLGKLGSRHVRTDGDEAYCLLRFIKEEAIVTKVALERS